VTNIAESKLAEMIGEWENQLPKEIHLAYLRFWFGENANVCTAETQARAHELVAKRAKCAPYIQSVICAFDDETMKNAWVRCAQKYATVSNAES
jgi:hypothetical protein